MISQDDTEYARLAASDPANTDVAAAMDRADAANRGAFSTVAPSTTSDQLRAARSPDDLISSAVERRNALMSGIASKTDPDNPALFVTSRRRAEMEHEAALHQNFAHQTALAQADKTHHAAVLDEQIDTANQVTGLINDVQGIKAPIGTPEYSQAYIQTLAKYPKALAAEGAQKFLNERAKIHDTAEGALNLTPPEGTSMTRIVRDSAGKEHAVFEPNPATETYESKQDLLQSNPNARPKQNAKGGWYDSGETTPKDPVTAFHQEVAGLGLKPYAFENKEQWKARPDGKMFFVDPTAPKDESKMITLSADHYQKLQSQYDAINGGGKKTSQFDNEDAARAAGHKTGDTVILKNPATGKYQRARLD